MLNENKPILEEANLETWHEAGYTGKGITIALLDDGGIAREHMKDYYFNILRKQDGFGHSTNVGYAAHVAAPDARILAFDAKRDFDEAFQWLQDHQAEVDLINISLAGFSGTPTEKYERLQELEIPIVCASGNDAYADRISYPARYDFTIAIGAWSWRQDDVAAYSNGGENLDAVVPSYIYMLRDDGHIWAVSGTSFASPFACGMLACYMEWRNEHELPKLTPEQIRKFIHDNSKDVENAGFDFESGHGLFMMPENIPVPPRREGPGVADAKVVYEKEIVTKTTRTEEEEVPAVIINGTTYVPIREVANLLGLELSYNNQTKTTTLRKA